jgi:vacuolar-type H+-ATPase subunit H
MADASKITPEEMSQAREEARRMISDADKKFQESLRGMNQSKRQLAIDRKAINDEEDKETARKIIEDRKAEFMRNRTQPQPQQQPQPQPQQRQPTSTILVGPQLRVVSNNFRNNGGKRTQRRRKQQRKMKHKRYSSRYKRKSKSRR